MLLLIGKAVGRIALDHTTAFFGVPITTHVEFATDKILLPKH